MADATLFPNLPATDLNAEPSAAERPVAPPRLRRADRHQVELRPLHLDALLAEDHQARGVWEYVEGLNLGPLHQAIRAVEGAPGHPPIDPKIMLALWIYATLDGVGSARALERLCTDHVVYQWICGGVSVNYHTLADFRVKQAALLDRLITESVAALRSEGLVDLNRVAQDGMRVRAGAGAPSFRRKPRLEAFLDEARQQVEALKKEIDEDPGATKRRQQAARLRAAEDRKKRVAGALRQLPEVQAKKRGAEEKEQARASTTDPDARVMKMPDGGFRPAYNVQFATDTGSQVIVGVDVTNKGNDGGHLVPMAAQIAERHGKAPPEILVDGGFVKLQDIEAVSAPPLGCTVYAPAMAPRDKSRDPHQPLETDSPVVAAWRVRMGTDAAKQIYKERAATAECVNAIARNRGLRQFVVRGLAKVRAVALWFALAHNIARTIVLRAVRRLTIPADLAIA